MPEPLIFHILPTFAPGGAQMRVTQIINHFGRRFRHTVLSLDSEFAAADWISPGANVSYMNRPKTDGAAGMFRALASAMKQIKPDLVLTYNWGSMDGVAAALLTRAAPVVHSEDGFGLDEAVKQKLRRVWTRRVLLRYSYAAVAPSQTLVRTMRNAWKLPARTVHYIPNGVDVNRFRPRVSESRTGEIVIGTVSQLRPEKRLQVLIDACGHAAKRHNIRLVVVGDGPERGMLERRAIEAGIASRVEFLGKVSNPEDCYRTFDIFALSSGTEQMPISVLEAMACGLPVLSTDVGDVKDMVSAANRPFVAGSAAYQKALECLVGDDDLRRNVGASNRKRCTEVYDVQGMLRTYERLYEDALALRPLPPVSSAPQAAGARRLLG